MEPSAKQKLIMTAVSKVLEYKRMNPKKTDGDVLEYMIKNSDKIIAEIK